MYLEIDFELEQKLKLKMKIGCLVACTPRKKYWISEKKNPRARGRIFKSELWYVGVGNEDD